MPYGGFAFGTTVRRMNRMADSRDDRTADEMYVRMADEL